jgi:hypothetical protein
MADNQSPKPVEAKKSPIPGPRWLWILGAVVAGFALMAVFNNTVPTPNSEPVPAPEPIGSLEPGADVGPTDAPLPTDAWVGTWTGVEGLRIDIEKVGAAYKLHIVNMDGEGDYSGVPDGEKIVFERAGKTETLTHGDGKATGLKWLADKTNCLVIQPGEGFCRVEETP